MAKLHKDRMLLSSRGHLMRQIVDSKHQVFFGDPLMGQPPIPSDALVVFLGAKGRWAHVPGLSGNYNKQSISRRTCSHCTLKWKFKKLHEKHFYTFNFNRTYKM